MQRAIRRVSSTADFDRAPRSPGTQDAVVLVNFCRGATRREDCVRVCITRDASRTELSDAEAPRLSPSLIETRCSSNSSSASSVPSIEGLKSWGVPGGRKAMLAEVEISIPLGGAANPSMPCPQAGARWSGGSGVATVSGNGGPQGQGACGPALHGPGQAQPALACRRVRGADRFLLKV
jgi:hypothetical protein